MTRPSSRRRRGLTLLELMLALVVTVMIAGAIASMLAAVRTGVVERRDARDALVAGHAAASRLGAYLAPSRCLLAAGEDELVLWLHDDRADGNVHASEIRWLAWDARTASIVVQWVDFPDEWTQSRIDLADRRYAADADWTAVRRWWADRGLLATLPLVDGLSSASFAIGEETATNARLVVCDLAFPNGPADVALPLSLVIRQHRPPSGAL